MALKDIFTIIKADRYTADGREELNKAIGNVTEDVKYNIGDISQKTGLQKTANGWVKPKSGKQLGKTGKPNPNGITAQQKQKLESEKHESARKDAQAPSKKTEVNTPGLRKDVQEAIKRSTPEEIKAYIKELRTPGSRMSRYFDNPDLLANVYEDELNKMTESKPAENKPSSSGVPIQGSNWLSLPSGTRVTNETARERVTQNNERIEAIKKQMEGKTKAEGFRLGSELKKLQNENEYITSRLPPEESKPADTPKVPKPTEQEYMKAKDRVEKYEKQFKKEMDDYEYMERVKANGVDTSIFNPMYGGKPKPLTENKSYMDALEKVKAYEAEDAAPRVLTGDCKIRVRKSK